MYLGQIAKASIMLKNQTKKTNVLLKITQLDSWGPIAECVILAPKGFNGYYKVHEDNMIMVPKEEFESEYNKFYN